MKSRPADASVSSPQKARFTPKVPVRKRPKSAAPEGNKSEKKDVIDKKLADKLNRGSVDRFGRQVPKMEGKSAPVQVSFGQGRTSLIRSFGNPRRAVTESKHEDVPDVSVTADEVTANEKYFKTWHYVRSYYPVTLPLRSPSFRDPDILDKEEFGEDAVNVAGKHSATHTEALGLMEASTKPQRFFFQFPAVLPLAKQPAAVDSKNSGGKQDSRDKSRKSCGWKDLPAGFIGKMLMHKSGKIKMKIGDAMYDVLPGQKCVFAEEFAVMNLKKKHCCIVGDLPKRVVVTPDIGSLLENL